MSATAAAPRFAASEADAEQRFARWRNVDPFPGIEPALLNAADIGDYVAATGLIFPFDESKLKPASYPLGLGGKILWWDNKTRKKRVVTLNAGDEFELQPNSIAFVTLAPLLQLPDYIALRFNLKIQNVYRGLLLGTGPLVDPGFVGHLSFPLHNLTTNPYHFDAAEDVVWVEFTKLSTNPGYNSGQAPPARAGAIKRYQAPANRHDVEDYVKEALRRSSNRHVWSSISEALADAQAAVRRSTFVNVAGAIAIVAIAVSILGVVATIFFGEWGLARRSDISKDQAQIAQLQREVRVLRAQIARTTSTTPSKPKKTGKG